MSGEAPRLGGARVAVSSAFASQGLLLAVLLTHLPAFKDRHHIGDVAVTAVIFAVTVLAGAGSVLAEVASRRRGSAVGLRAALFVEVVAVTAIGFAPDLFVFCLGFAAYGVALGVVDATSNMQAVALEHRYGRSILTSFHAVWSAAGIAGALWTAVSKAEAETLWWALAAPALAVAVLTQGTARSYVTTSAGAGTHLEPTDRAVRRVVTWIGIAMACFYVVDSGTSSWSTIYLHDVLGADNRTAALAFAGYQATSVLARVIGDHAVRRWGSTRVVRCGAALGVGGLVSAVAATGPWAAIIGFTLVGLGLPVVAPLAFAAAGRIAPGAADAVIARVNIFNYAGALGGGVLVGGVGSAAGLRAGFVVPLGFCAAVLALAPVFAGRAPSQGETERSAPQAARDDGAA